MEEIVVRYCHFLGIIVLFSCITAEHLLVKKELAPAELRRLSIVDLIYGVSALVVLATGLGQWFFGAKGAGFYSSNPVFYTKIGLFLAVALISIYPTIFFVKNRNAAAAMAVPRSIFMVLRIELALLLVIPLLAVVMAEGIGSR